MSALPVTPYWPWTERHRTSTHRKEYEDGYVHARSKWFYTVRLWGLRWRGMTRLQAEALQAFYSEHKGPTNAFEYEPDDPLPRPYRAPVTGVTAGGALGSRTLYAAHAYYVYPDKYTPVSYEVATQSLNNGELLVVTVPRRPPSLVASPYDLKQVVYVGTSASALHEQDTISGAKGGTWTEPSGGYDDEGAAPAAANNLAETVSVYFEEESLRIAKVWLDYYSAEAEIGEIVW